METPNAFIGKVMVPSAQEVTAVLGKTAELWKQLVDWLTEQNVTGQEWQSVSPKCGWASVSNSKSEPSSILVPAMDVFA